MIITKQLLNKAIEIVGGDRQKEYGDKVENHDNIAKLWSAYLDVKIEAHDVSVMMILLNVVHPPAGGNPIMVIIGSASYDYLINPIIFGCIIILLLAIIINKYILKKNYPLK